MTAPSYMPILAYPKPWTMGTKSKVAGQPVIAEIRTKEDMEKHRGKLKGAIVFTEQPRGTKPVFEPIAKRYTDQDLEELAETPIPVKPRDRDRPKQDGLKFDWIGIPGFQFVQDPLDYTPQVHHTNQDVYDHCVPEDLVQSAIVMASFVYHTAMREKKLPRKPLPIPAEMK